MIEYFSEDIEFLKELLSKDKVELYFFHNKYMLSPAQMARTINKFEELGLIDITNDEVSLNELGRRWIIENRKFLFLNENVKYWKEIPEEMKQKKIAINKPFKPNRRNIDKELFNNIEDGN